MRAAPRAEPGATADTEPDTAPTTATGPGPGPEPGDPAPPDADRMALSLVTLWAMRTGRTPPPAPYTALTGIELLAFWADPALEPDDTRPDPPAG
ncbi:hypothetical protein [Actinomadura harenae]|uniref:Uncharacterized protein n=1 Tax=Actinomadura harenae TaxID=2483351 RepID=A0A3M2L5Z8_9ACTN|nr:hypothetical protein [Actinomadura harenae]RMI33122.1 hypothetical protein EBO15_41690 [Actinomadura harenae]